MTKDTADNWKSDEPAEPPKKKRRPTAEQERRRVETVDKMRGEWAEIQRLMRQ